MYNDLTYCSPENIKEITAISQNVNEKYIEPFLVQSEAMHIVKGVLGDALDTSLKGMIEAGTLSGDSENLVENFIIPASAWYAYYDCVPFLSMKAKNVGLVKTGNANDTPVDRDEMKDYRVAIYEKAQWYRNQLIDYLEDNKETFPLYRSDCEPAPKKGFSGGFYIPKR